MRTFVKNPLAMLFAFIFTISANAQVAELNNLEIIEETVPGKFWSLKAVSGNQEVIFRDDRLEIFERNGKEEKQSFLFFNGAKDTRPIGMVPVKSSLEKINNPNMVQALGSEELTSTRFQKVFYKEIYPNVDLTIEVVNGSLDFKFVAKKGAEIPFSFSSWDNNNLSIDNNKIYLKQHEGFEINALQNGYDMKDGKLSFVDNNKSSNSSLTFQINLN